MTENLLQSLEDKITSLLKEMETLRRELIQLKHENFSLKVEKANSTKKLQALISLCDATEMLPPALIANELEVLHG